jgi:hypothetical protein
LLLGRIALFLPYGGNGMEVPLCHIDIVQDGEVIIAMMKSELGKRRIASHSLEGVLEQLFTELEEEFESIM